MSARAGAGTELRRTLAAGARVLQGVAALLFLNAALSFENLFPTPGIRLSWSLAPEFVVLWVLLLAVQRLGTPGRRLIGGLAGVYALLVIGRYADVTAPALLGRAINLYWDGSQLPRFLSVTGQALALWQKLAIALGVVVALWALYRVLRLAIGVAAREAAPLVLRSKAAFGASIAALVLVSANAAGFRAPWPELSRPVTPTYLRQADLLLTAFSPTRLASVLPPSPAFDSDLAALAGRDVKLLFLESYGALVFDNSEAHRRLAASREDLARRIEATGRQVVSAYVRSPTFGGASDLAHLSLLSGIDLSDPLRHDLLLTTGRPTLITLFRARGYETYGVYPALSWDWPEHVFYRFEHFLDGPALGYRGPRFGFWWIPDQFSIARVDQLYPVRPESPPRLLFLPTIVSHIPFQPTPPYQPDWARVLSAQPYAADEVARAQAEPIDWTNLLPGYLRTIEYTYAWLAGYLEQPSPRDYLLILIGDHQPAGSVSGPGASWDVPVHVVTSSTELAARFLARGFRPGIEPRRPVLGGMHELTRVLLDAFAGAGGSGAVHACPGREVRPGAAG